MVDPGRRSSSEAARGHGVAVSVTDVGATWMRAVGVRGVIVCAT